MTLRPPIRALLVVVIAVTYLAAALWAAGTGAFEALAPLSRAMTIAVPLAVGLIASLAPTRPHPVLGLGAAVLVLLLAMSHSISVGWLPLAYYAFAGAWIGGVALAGAIVGSLIGDTRVRVAAAVIVALAAPFVTKFEAAVERASDASVTTKLDVVAPAQELWEEIIGPDSVGAVGADSSTARADNPTLVAVSMADPRPSELRRLVFSDSSAQVERIAEWEDAEWLRVASGSRVLAVPRGLAAWRAGWGKGAVLQTAATYEIIERGDTTTLSIASRYRMHLHPRAYPAGWVTQVATARAEAFVAAFRDRAERRVKEQAPSLTAEMRSLRRYLLEDFKKRADAEIDLGGVLPGFINGERRVELADFTSLVPGRGAPTATRQRQALLLNADAARTTGWIATLVTTEGATQADSVELRFEDYLGRCVSEVSAFSRNAAGELSVGVPRRERCAMDVMARRAARSRLVAELPLSAGEVGDHWSVPLIVRGITRVFLDSIVVRADTLRFKSTPSDGKPVVVDSIGFGLSQKTERSWYLGRHGTSITLGQTFAKDAEWSRSRVRFSVAADSTVSLNQSWPTFQTVLSIPKTTDNPYGVAWTYAHAPMAYFNGVRR